MHCNSRATASVEAKEKKPRMRGQRMVRECLAHGRFRCTAPLPGCFAFPLYDKQATRMCSKGGSVVTRYCRITTWTLPVYSTAAGVMRFRSTSLFARRERRSKALPDQSAADAKRGISQIGHIQAPPKRSKPACSLPGSTPRARTLTVIVRLPVQSIPIRRGSVEDPT